MIRLLDFYLVEDVDSRDAENEGLSLILRFKWLPQGIFWLVDGVKTPPQSVSVSAMLVSMRQKNIAQVSILDEIITVSLLCSSASVTTSNGLFVYLQINEFPSLCAAVG